jgi:hypothetical protein
MKKATQKLAKLLSSNKQLLLGLGAGLLVAVPITVYSVRSSDTKELAQTPSQISGQPTPNVTTDNSQPATPTEAIDKGVARSNNTQSAPPKTTSPTPTTAPAPAPAPTPTELSTCVYQNGPKAGLPCPYSPPPAWSTNTQFNPCLTSSGSYAPCSEYGATVSIEGVAVREDFPQPTWSFYCVFTFNNGNSRWSMVQAGSGTPDNLPDCTFMPALNYDPYQ